MRPLQQNDVFHAIAHPAQRQLPPKPLKEVLSWVDEFEVFFNVRLDALAAHPDRKHGRKKK